LDLKEFYAVAAPHYDAVYDARAYDADIPFYRDLAAAGGEVLEMGCGTGRILLPTARAGARIHGLEASGDMLRQLRRKLAREPAEVRRRVSISLGDIRTARLERRYALVTAPFRVVQHLVEREDQRAWLRNVARHLRPGGALCFDVFQPDYRIIAKGVRERLEVDAGRRLRLFAKVVSYPEAQRMEVTFRWRLAGVSDKSATFTMRWFTRGELENLLDLEGFRITDYWGSFDREPFGAGSGHQIVRAVRRPRASH